MPTQSASLGNAPPLQQPLVHLTCLEISALKTETMREKKTTEIAHVCVFFSMRVVNRVHQNIFIDSLQSTQHGTAPSIENPLKQLPGHAWKLFFHKGIRFSY